MKIVRAGSGPGSVTLYDFEPTPDRLCDDVVRGLGRSPRVLPSKYFYDERGAALFEQITRLETYYPTRTEISILERHAGEIAERIGPGVRLVEFGSGSGEKTWLILRSLESPSAYVPVDISRTQLLEFAIRVADAFPALRVDAVCADYTADYQLPLDGAGARRSVAFFPGSTIGNFESAEATAFLRRVRRLVGEGGGLLLGVDLRKDSTVIENAYNDPEGVTAEFNLNLLRRINRECGANFAVDSFGHRAIFDPDAGRIEMRLVAERPHTVLVPVPDDEACEARFDPGDFIITEYSHKYDRAELAEMAANADWRISAEWSDDRDWFSVVLLE